jgi:hypothetical protein
MICQFDKMCCQSMITKWHIKANYKFCQMIKLPSIYENFWGWEMKQPMIPFWIILGMRNEATPESVPSSIPKM